MSQAFITGAAASTSLSPGAEHLLRRALSALVRALGGMGQRPRHPRGPAASCPQAAPQQLGDGLAQPGAAAEGQRWEQQPCPSLRIQAATDVRAGIGLGCLGARTPSLRGGAVAVYEYIGWWVARGQEGTLGGGN